MKLRLRRQDLINAINFYNEQLAHRFGSKALSPARREIIERGFVDLQAQKQNREKTNVWFAPFYVKFESNGFYSVTIDEYDKRILIMDW
jgi:hypothetical protein